MIKTNDPFRQDGKTGKVYKRANKKTIKKYAKMQDLQRSIKFLDIFAMIPEKREETHDV